MPQSLGESSILTHLHLVIRLTMSYKTHLTVLQHSAAVYSSSPAFLLPRLDTNDSNVIVAWDSISYQQFLLDVERSARHWSHTLTAHGVPRRSVVGLWSVRIHWMQWPQTNHIHSAGLVAPNTSMSFMSTGLQGPGISRSYFPFGSQAPTSSTNSFTVPEPKH